MMRYFQFFSIIVVFFRIATTPCMCFVRSNNRCSLENEVFAREDERETDEQNNNKRIHIPTLEFGLARAIEAKIARACSYFFARNTRFPVTTVLMPRARVIYYYYYYYLLLVNKSPNRYCCLQYIMCMYGKVGSGYMRIFVHVGDPVFFQSIITR